MKNYEIMFIVRPTLDEASINKTCEDMKKVLEKEGSQIKDVKEMGQRDLAYEINKYKTGYYFLLTLEAPVNAINEFKRIANVSEDVIRYLVVNLEK